MGDHRILLLNPPARGPVFRDGYCSGFGKGPFSVHPLDLLIQSGYFIGPPFSMSYLDAVAGGLTPQQTLGRIRNIRPKTILALVGEAMLGEDARFLSRVKAGHPEADIFITGDLARFQPAQALAAMPDVSGILFDFGTDALRRYLLDGVDAGLFFGESDMSANTRLAGSFRYPLPHRDIVGCRGYRLPFFRDPVFYSIATAFGCPFGCRYCNTHRIGYRTRPLSDVLKELRRAAELGFRSLYVRDATFFAGEDRHRTLLKQWQKTQLRFEWMCFARPDLIDDHTAGLAARAGCSLMMLGVESPDEKSLESQHRGMTLKDVHHAFAVLRRNGIRTAAQIMVAMGDMSRGGTRGYTRRLKNLLNHIDPDFVALNVFHPRPGLDMTSRELSEMDGDRKRNMKLADDLNRWFYLNPRRGFRQVLHIRTAAQLKMVVSAGLSVFK